MLGCHVTRNLARIGQFTNGVAVLEQHLHNPQSMWMGQRLETFGSVPQSIQIGQLGFLVGLCLAHFLALLLFHYIGISRYVNQYFPRFFGRCHKLIRAKGFRNPVAAHFFDASRIRHSLVLDLLLLLARVRDNRGS